MIFATGALAMCAFANVTMQYFIKPLKIHETVLLLGVVLSILRPELLMGWLGYGHKFGSYFLGTALYAGVYGLQRLRGKA